MKVISEKELPAYLREIRGDRTQEEFGKFLGVAKQSIMQYEKGLSCPKPNVLKKLGIEKCFRIK